MTSCKDGKVKNANGRCVKVKSECKDGKVKNASGRCVKAIAPCKSGKERNSKGRCVNKCKEGQHRNSDDKCVSNKTRKARRAPSPHTPSGLPPSSHTPPGFPPSRSSSSRTSPYHTPLGPHTLYRKPLPISARKMRGKLLTKKRHLRHYKKTSTPSSTSDFSQGMHNFKYLNI